MKTKIDKVNKTADGARLEHEQYKTIGVYLATERQSNTAEAISQIYHEAYVEVKMLVRIGPTI